VTEQDLAPHGAALLWDVPERTLRVNVERVRQTLLQNARPGQPPATLVAVTKTVAAPVIDGLLSLGVMDIGENRVQVALPKLPLLTGQFRLHWIGRLQTNKVKDIIERVWLLHSLDRPALAQEVERRADQCGRTVDALVQVNIAGEPQKAGFTQEDAIAFLRGMKDYRNLRVRGLMAIMPLTDDEAALAGWFRAMRTLFERLRDEALPGVDMRELSMGMSHDYAIAAREGATMVRVGTALYTPR
jgi:pyridoxal phosphate enzyme (YggS family)